jgi:hypothetical protein
MFIIYEYYVAPSNRMEKESWIKPEVEEQSRGPTGCITSELQIEN